MSLFDILKRQPKVTPGRKYGWKPDVPDLRDLKFSVPTDISSVALPISVDLRPKNPAIYDQGDLGSCTANAIGRNIQFDLIKQNIKAAFMPSRLFIYYNERVMEHTVNSDSGAQIRDGVKTINIQGVCPETMWPYVVNKFAKKPGVLCYANALLHKSLIYQRLTPTLNDLKGCLAAGNPFAFGIAVYESFESQAVAKTGVVPMPGPTERSLGGHAICAVGYDDSIERFIVANSWGIGWGMAGYFTLPYAYLTSPNLSDDFWVIKTMK